MYRLILPALLLIGSASALSADTKGYKARQAAADQAELDKQLAGLVSGKPQTCIDQRRNVDTSRIGDTILYKFSRREIYRVDTGGGCYGLSRGDAIVTKTYGSQFCRGDIVDTVDLTSRIPSGTCTFGDFIPYRRP